MTLLEFIREVSKLKDKGFRAYLKPSPDWRNNYWAPVVLSDSSGETYDVITAVCAVKTGRVFDSYQEAGEELGLTGDDYDYEDLWDASYLLHMDDDLRQKLLDALELQEVN